MKHKLSFVLMTAFVLVLSLAVVSASISVNPTTVILTKSDTSETFTVADDADLDANDITINGLSPTVSITDGVNSFNVNLAGVLTVADNDTVGNIITATMTVPTTFDTGVFSKTVTLAEGAASSTMQIVFINQFCSAGTQNAPNLDLSIDVSNRGDGEDSDDFDWYPRDRIEIDVDFDNDKDLDGAGDLEDVTFELGLFEKSTGKNIAEDLAWESKDDEQIELGNIDEGDKESHTFEFIVPNDIEPGDYTLMIKVYEEDNEGVGGTCLDHDTSENKYFYDVSIDRESNEDRWMLFDNVKLDSTSAPCGSEATLTAKMYNIGEQDEEAVKVILLNKELGIEKFQIVEKLDMDESANVEFTFDIPEDAVEKTYTLSLYAKYDYDEDDDEDEEYPDDAFDEESDPVKVYLTVEGNCAGTIDDIEISKTDTESLNKGVKAYAGKKAVYLIPIKNTGDKELTLDLSVSGTSGWASADVADSVTIAAGETENVEVTIDIDSDASGEQEFALKMELGAKSKSQAVKLNIEQGGLFAGSVIGEHIRDNAFIYAVVAIDIILIIIIILAVRGMVRKRPGS